MNNINELHDKRSTKTIQSIFEIAQHIFNSPSHYDVENLLKQ